MRAAVIHHRDDTERKEAFSGRCRRAQCVSGRAVGTDRSSRFLLSVLVRVVLDHAHVERLRPEVEGAVLLVGLAAVGRQGRKERVHLGRSGVNSRLKEEGGHCERLPNHPFLHSMFANI